MSSPEPPRNEEYISAAFGPVPAGLNFATNASCAPPPYVLWYANFAGRSSEDVVPVMRIDPSESTAMPWPASSPLPPKYVR